jgi:hypothetical protein
MSVDEGAIGWRFGQREAIWPLMVFDVLVEFLYDVPDRIRFQGRLNSGRGWPVEVTKVDFAL